MPGPVIRQSPLPDWADPKQASVFDVPGQGLLRQLVGFLGLDDPRAVMQVGGPMVTLAPRLPAADLIERFAPAETASPEIRRAVEYLVQRFPRLMSHVEAIRPARLASPERPLVQGQMDAGFVADFPGFARDKTRPVASIKYDPTTMPKGEELNVLAHELTHVAQAVKQTDLASRIASEPKFLDLYRAMNKAQGYYNNPMEVAARSAAESTVLKKARLFDPRNVAEKVFETTGDPSVVASRLRQLFPANTEQELTRALRYATKDPAAVMPAAAQQLSRRVLESETPEIAQKGYRVASNLLDNYGNDAAAALESARSIAKEYPGDLGWVSAVKRLEQMVPK